MKGLIIGIVSVLLFSCGEKESKNNQEQKSKTLSRIHFDDLVGEGTFLRNDFPIGLWRYYDSKNRLLEVKQFIDIKNSPYLNQNWTFDIKGDTIPELSYYYKILFEKDTISLNEPVKALVDLKGAFFNDQPSSIMVLIPQKNSENFNSDFSNISKVLKDTIYNLNTEKDYREQASLNGDYRRSVFFGRYFDTIGLKKIKGIIVEFNSDGEFSDAMNADYKEHYYYFEKDIFVKE
ncbi:MAG: hypothetical protein ACTIJ9_15285 [Aequorivita sp.]